MKQSISPLNLYLIGFSGTGKSALGPRVAAAIGYHYVDTDDIVVRAAGKSIAEIFEKDGEQAFRDLERSALSGVAGTGGAVVSTGGGVPLDTENRRIMHETGVVVLLEAKPETVLSRLQQDKAGSVRPLLSVPNPLQRISELKRQRLDAYATADWTVHTDKLSLAEAVQEVVRGWEYLSRDRFGAPAGYPEAAVVTTASHSYPVYSGWGILETVGQKMAALGLKGAALLVTDETVGTIYGQRVLEYLRQSGFSADMLMVPAGEQAKNLGTVSRIYDFLVEHHAERRDTVVALGGGVVGDIAGFAAASFNRGMNFVQAPTTLVGMVDSSIGGKVGVDHPRGKNLIGAFHQPCLVVSDVQLLSTLPSREMSAGWAEVVKHGLIADADYFSWTVNSAADLLALREAALVKAVSGSIAVKAGIVSSDEKETLGLRTILNYGHTIGHAIETATGYGRYLHGEAVAIGMVGAAILSHKLGLVDRGVIEIHRLAFKGFNLPEAAGGVRRADVLRAMKLDKKSEQGAIKWVLLEGIGKAAVRKDVPQPLVEDAFSELGV